MHLADPCVYFYITTRIRPRYNSHLVGGGCVVRTSVAAWGELGLLESDGLGVMINSGDDVNLASGEGDGYRSSDSTPAARK
jgi:hypothetical protein